jgi:DNA-binding MarR family transcriptional regulator
MSTPEPQITITLSPTQIDAVVHAASSEHTPGFAALISAALSRAETQDGVPEYDDRRLSRSLLRGLAILTCFGPNERTLGLMEIANRLKINPSTVHRYLLTLVEVGLLEQCPKTRRYRLPEI